MTAYLLAGPAVEPVTLAEAKAWLRLDAGDDDALVTTLTTAARLHVEATTGLALITQSWRLVRDGWPPDGTVKLPVSPLQSLTAITAYDAEGAGSELALDDVLTDAAANPSSLLLPAGFGAGRVFRSRQGIEIDYVAGCGDDGASVPAALRQTMLTLLAYWFENRDAVVMAGAGSIIPQNFDLMVAPYRAVRL